MVVVVTRMRICAAVVQQEAHMEVGWFLQLGL